MSNEQHFSSIWDAIEDTAAAAASMRARSDLMLALQVWAKTTQGTQAEASRRLGITQPRMSDLMRGKISLFSLDTLMDMASTAGLNPQIKVELPDLVADDKDIDKFEEFFERTVTGTGNAVAQEARAVETEKVNFLLVDQGTSGSSSTEALSRPTLRLVNSAARAA